MSAQTYMLVVAAFALVTLVLALFVLISRRRAKRTEPAAVSHAAVSAYSGSPAPHAYAMPEYPPLSAASGYAVVPPSYPAPTPTAAPARPDLQPAAQSAPKPELQAVPQQQQSAAAASYAAPAAAPAEPVQPVPETVGIIAPLPEPTTRRMPSAQEILAEVELEMARQWRETHVEPSEQECQEQQLAQGAPAASPEHAPSADAGGSGTPAAPVVITLAEPAAPRPSHVPPHAVVHLAQSAASVPVTGGEWSVAAHSAAKHGRPTVRVTGIPVLVPESETPVEEHAAVPEVELVSPVEMWFGPDRVGVRPGTRTFERLRRYADVMLDDLSSSKSDS